MCLAVPRKILKIEGNKAFLQDKRWVRLDLVTDVAVGDFVIVSADLAVEKITAAEAKEMKDLLDESDSSC